MSSDSVAAAKASLASRALWRGVSAEFTATFLFVYIGVGSALTTLGAPEGAAMVATEDLTGGALVAIALCFGLTIFVLAHVFGPVSGAHINPAVTFALMIAQQVDFVKGLLYMAAQFLGSIVATVILMASMGLQPEAMGGYNKLSGPDGNRFARGFLTEMILTFSLVMAVFATIDPSRAAAAGLGPLAIGMAVTIAHLVAVPVTGCGINPARSLGPALFADADAAKEDLWVFLTAPFVGAAVAALLYPLWFAEKNFIGGSPRSDDGHERV